MFPFSIWNHKGDFPNPPRRVAETSVLVTNKAQTFLWVGYGLKIEIPQDALPTGLNHLTLYIRVSTSGHFTLPQNTALVSAVYWLDIEPRGKFSKPITVAIQHCVKPTYSSILSFVRAQYFQTDPPYVFEPVVEGEFSSESRYGRYGRLQLTHCSFQLLGVVRTVDNSVLVPEAAPLQYCAWLYYLKREREIHIVITRGQEPVSSELLCSYCCSLLHIQHLYRLSSENTLRRVLQLGQTYQLSLKQRPSHCNCLP